MDVSFPQIALYLALAALLLVLPGAALYLATHRDLSDRRLPTLGRALLVGSGLSVAFWPLLLFYLTLIGLRLTPLLAWLAIATAAIFIIYWLLRHRQGMVPSPGHSAMALSLGGMALLALFYRLGDIQGLPVPMFGDSLHHSLISTLIYESGQVPSDYGRYVPVETFTYHFGFHTLTALFAQLSGLSVPHAVLLLGQVLIMLAVPLAYALNRALFGSRLAGLGAALLTGFVSIMPAFYVNWGRYTQLAGHLLLIPALIFLTRLLSPNWRWRDLAMTALCVAGLVVVHYRILIFFSLYAIALAIYQTVSHLFSARTTLRVWCLALLPSARGLLAIAVGFVATLPWIINLATNYLRGLVERLRTVTPDYLQQYNNPDALILYAGRLLPALAFAGLIIAIIYLARNRNAALTTERSEEAPHASALPPPASVLVLALWTILLVASLWVVPGALGSITVAITLYIPLAALGGYAIGWLCGQISRLLRISPAVFAPLLLLVAPLSAQLLGTSRLADTGRHMYVHPPDLRAFDWVKQNLPQDATFLISSEFSYVGRGLTASDAGMWLPVLTGRKAIPPTLSAWVERPADPDFFTNTRELAAYTQPRDDRQQHDRSTQATLVQSRVITEPRSLSDPRTLDLMRQLGITHLYSGAQAGASKPRLDISAMRRDTRHYRLIYAEEGVYIFEVLY